jgi:hypothetical protein
MRACSRHASDELSSTLRKHVLFLGGGMVGTIMANNL